MGVGWIDRMPLAVDDDDGDLALTLGQRVAGPEISTQQPHHLRKPGIVHPDLVRAAERTTNLDQRAITLLLRRRHLIVRNFGVPAEGWCIGHLGLPPDLNWRNILRRRHLPVDLTLILGRLNARRQRTHETNPHEYRH